MRYWIWWNDLIQGPFELDELVSLRVFGEDLLVCMEDHEEWLFAGRIADLSAAVEQQKIARAEPLAPPPPPPNRPPAATPLQGQFFSEPPGQQSLLYSEDEPNGPYAYRPAAGEADPTASYFLGQVTMPFHFSRQPDGATVILEDPPLRVEKKSLFSRVVHTESLARDVKPVVEEIIARKPAVTLNLLQDDPLESVQKGAQPAVREILPAVRETLPPLGSPYEEQPVFGRKLELLPWIMGVALAIGLLTMAGYWVMDKVSTHSAITEANRLEPPTPIALPPATPLAPVVDVPASPPIKKRSAMASMRKTVRAALSTMKKGVHARKVSGVKAIRSVIGSAKSKVSAWRGRSGAAAAHLAVVVTPAVVTPVFQRVDIAPVESMPSPVSVPRQVHRPAAKPKKPIGHKVPKTAAHAVVHGATAAGVSAAAETSAKVIPPVRAVVQPASGKSEPPAQVSPVVSDAPVLQRQSDPWAQRQSEAIKGVMAKTLTGGKNTVGGQAKTMLMQMHEKELMHAAETGERLYLPDQMAWAALQEDGSRYRVYLNFLAMQANGERVQTRSYQFIVDLKSKAIRADDSATDQDMLTQNAELNFKHNPMATDIDAVLGGVDTFNKHKVQMIIIKKNRSNRDQRTKIESALNNAQSRIRQSIIYFRRTYPDKALQNVAKAYNFAELVNGHP